MKNIKKILVIFIVIFSVIVNTSTFAKSYRSSKPHAECRDGSISYSINRRGTCSHHGGVKV